MAEEGAIPEILDQMSTRDIILALLVLKPGPNVFLDSALYHGIEKVLGDHPEYGSRFFTPTGDGTSPFHSDGLERTLSILHGLFTASCSDIRFDRLTEDGKEYVDREVKDEYGSDILEKMKPFAEAVWRAAQSYNSFLNQPRLYEPQTQQTAR